MPNNHNSKQRCEQCKSVLIKGTVISVVGEAKVRCEKCYHINVLAVVPTKVHTSINGALRVCTKPQQAVAI